VTTIGRAIAQKVSYWLPTAAALVRAQSDHVGSFSQSTSVSPTNHHSTKFSIFIITRGMYSRPICGRRAEWTQLDSAPSPLFELKKNSDYIVYKVIL
jgi:hypothetical protein